MVFRNCERGAALRTGHSLSPFRNLRLIGIPTHRHQRMETQAYPGNERHSRPAVCRPVHRISKRLLRNARLASGLVLMLFVVDASGQSRAQSDLARNGGGRAGTSFSRSGAIRSATVLLYGSLLVHFVLALLALYRRRTLEMPPREAAQVVLGLLIPLLVAEHVVGTRILHELYDVRRHLRICGARAVDRHARRSASGRPSRWS